jgi:hypothetical protein
MSGLIRRRTFVTGSLASVAVVRHASAEPPAAIADGTRIGRSKLLVVHEDAATIAAIAIRKSCPRSPRHRLEARPRDAVTILSPFMRVSPFLTVTTRYFERTWSISMEQ